MVIGPGAYGPPSSPLPMPAGWAELVAEIEACRRCPLHASRTQVVVYRGTPRPRVLFLGEAPGAEEDRIGRPFVGRSGRRVDAALDRLGLSPAEVGFLNLLKCRPPDNRFPPASAMACRPFLDRQLELLGPDYLVTLGRHALGALDPAAPAIGACAGSERTGPDGRRFFALLHPAAVLHAPRWRDRWDRDLGELRRTLEALGLVVPSSPSARHRENPSSPAGGSGPRWRPRSSSSITSRNPTGPRRPFARSARASRRAPSD